MLMQADTKDLFAIPQNPVPSGAEVAWIRTKDSVKLRTALANSSKNISK
jgi:hypothetical protein